MKVRAEAEAPAARRGRARREARARRHPRRRVRGPAPAARARPRRRRAAGAGHARLPSTQLPAGRVRRSRRRRRAGRLLPVPAPGRARACSSRTSARPTSVPADRDRRRRVARVLGFRGTPAAGPTEAFDARRWPATAARVRTVHERVWFRPLLASLSGRRAARARRRPRSGSRPSGSRDVERTRQAVAELTTGLTRSSRMMQQLLPLLLDWLSASPDPDLGLLGLRRLASGEQRSTALAIAFRDSPEVARHLALLLGTSRQLGDVLVANPDLIERLPDPERLRTRPWDELVDERPERHLVAGRAATSASGRCSAGSSATCSASRPATCSVTPTSSRSAPTSRCWPRPPSRARSRSLDPQVPFAVVAFGRFGGAELGYASDLDVAFVHEGADARRRPSGWPAGSCGSSAATPPPSGSGPSTPTCAPRGAAARWPAASRGGRATSTAGPRPGSGRRTCASGAVAGDPELGQRLVDRIRAAVWERPLTRADEREVRRMKVRIEQERIAPGEDPEFHLKLGRGSLVRHRVHRAAAPAPPPRAAGVDHDRASASLVEAGHLPADEADVLGARPTGSASGHGTAPSWSWGPGDSLPTRPELIARWPGRSAAPCPSSGRSTGGSPGERAGWSSGASTTALNGHAP